MSANYPASLDTAKGVGAAPTGVDLSTTALGHQDTNDSNNQEHADKHNDISTVIVKLETKVGIDSSIDNYSHDYRINSSLFCTRTSNATFTIPAVGVERTLTLDESCSWTAVNQLLFIGDGTNWFFGDITTRSSGTSIGVTNRGFPGSSAANTTVGARARVVFAGPALASSSAPGFCPQLDGSTITTSGGKLAVGAIPESSVTNLTTDLGNKAPTSRLISTQYSLTGGGDLTADRTLNLVNDANAPGNVMGYGTDGSGVRGWYARVPTTRLVSTTSSLTGGGDLSADRTLSLVNDSGTPGNSMLYGTNASGVKGWYAQPSGGGGGTSYLTTFSSFTMPAVGNTQSVTVGSTSDLVVNETVTVTDGTNTASLLITAVGTGTVTLKNNGASGNLGSGSTMGGGHVYLGTSLPTNSTTQAGIVTAAPNNSAQFWNGTAAWSTPPTVTASAAGYAPTLTNTGYKFFRDDGGYQMVSKSIRFWNAKDADTPSGTNTFPVFTTVNNNAVLSFDPTNKNTCTFAAVMPDGVPLGSGVNVRIVWCVANTGTPDTTTTHNVVWSAYLDRANSGAVFSSDSFDTGGSATQTVTTAITATAATILITSIPIASGHLDLTTNGDPFRLQVNREATNASDSCTSASWLYAVELQTAST
jgi:hypothetical protein